MEPLEEDIPDDVSETGRVHQLGIEDQMAFYGGVCGAANACVKGRWQIGFIFRAGQIPKDHMTSISESDQCLPGAAWTGRRAVRASIDYPEQFPQITVA